MGVLKMQDKDVRDVMQKLEDGVKSVFESDRYKNYLKFMGTFHNYSVNNIVLIMMQKPDASLVAGYKAWQSKGRQVRKGEKAIRILAPCPHKAVKEVDGEEKEIRWTTYRVASVFDVSQTDGEDLPESVCKTLDAAVDGYDDLIKRLETISPYPVSYEEISGTAHGFCSFEDRRVVVRRGMSQLQTVKTLVHEISHAILHSKNGDKDVRELSASMEIIRKTANEIMAEIKEPTAGEEAVGSQKDGD